MNGKNWMIGLLGVAAVGLVSLPSYAGDGDDATIMDSNQNSVITGDGNTSLQDSTQSSQSIRDGARGNSGTVMRNNQNCDVLGNDNTCAQKSTQTGQSIRTNRGGSATQRSN